MILAEIIGFVFAHEFQQAGGEIGLTQQRVAPMCGVRGQRADVLRQ